MIRRGDRAESPRRDKTHCLPIGAFGEDHWTLLAYVDYCCSGRAGRVEHRHMRRNSVNPNGDEPTVVISGNLESSRKTTHTKHHKGTNSGLSVQAQDDWDRLADLEAAGFVELVSYATGLVHIFPVGLEAAAALREHGARGGSVKSFRYA